MELDGLVICAVDDSQGARDAARVADELARRLGARMLVVHGAQVPVVPGASGVPHGREDLRELAREDAEEVLARVVEDCGCFEAERQVAFGEPAQAVMKLADSEEATMIVVGSRGRSALRAALLGSLSLRLCRAAPCPVLVVPPGARLALQQPADAARAGG
jgi:nucleotide-binding universal stress UspA family protein